MPEAQSSHSLSAATLMSTLPCLLAPAPHLPRATHPAHPRLPTAQVKPEAQSYYSLGAATLKFTFPEPAPLDGVTSRQKSILNMKKVGARLLWCGWGRCLSVWVLWMDGGGGGRGAGQRSSAMWCQGAHLTLARPGGCGTRGCLG